MQPLFRSFFRNLKSSRRSRVRRRPETQYRQPAEILELRLSPTIVVAPAFDPTQVLWNAQIQQGKPLPVVPGQTGNQSYSVSGNSYLALNGPIAAGTNPFALKSPTIYLIFWGPTWLSPDGQTPIASVASTVNKIKTTISPQNGFLSTLAEYGSDGNANFGGAWIDKAADDVTQGGQASVNELTSIFQGQRAGNLLPVSGPGPLLLPTISTSSTNSPPLYVIIRNTTTASTNDTFPAKNYLIPYQTKIAPLPIFPTVTINVNAIQIENGSDADSINELFSHEVQERITAGDKAGNDSLMFLPSTLQSAWLIQEGTWIQICDGEPDGGAGFYTFRLGGPGTPIVQAAWSISRQAYVVAQADTTHVYNFTPRWIDNSTPYKDANGNLNNGASTDANFKYDLSVVVNSGDSLSISYDAASQSDLFTWGNGQQQAFPIYSVGDVHISLAGFGNHTISLGDLTGLSTVAVTPTAGGATTDIIKRTGKSDVNLLNKTDFTAVVNSDGTLYLAIDTSGLAHDLVSLIAAEWTISLPAVKSFSAGYSETHGSHQLLALTQDGLLHNSFDASFWNTIQAGVTKYDYGVFPVLKAGSNISRNVLVTLDSTDTLTPYVQFAPMAKLAGIRDFEITHWDGRTTLSILNESGFAYAYWGPTSDPLAGGGSLSLIANMKFEWNGFKSADVLQGTRGDFYLGLNADGTLLDSEGTTGWLIDKKQIRSTKVAPWAGGQYAFALDADGNLFTSPDGLVWTGQGNNFASFDVGNFLGSERLFGLKNDGTLWSSTGSGWSPVASHVRSFQIASWLGSDYAFYLDNRGNLYGSQNGVTFALYGSSIQAFTIGNMNAVDTLYMLTGDGRLFAYTTSPILANFAAPILTNVQSFKFAHFSGQNTLFALDGHGVLRTMVDGANWLYQGSGITAFDVGLFSTIPYLANPTVNKLAGTTTDYLFALNANGVLQRSNGSFWVPIATDVASLQVARWLNANYVFYRTNANVLKTSRDGVVFVGQGSNIDSFAVANLAGVDQLIALTTTQVLQISSGLKWTPVATQVKSFTVGFYGVINHLVDLHYNGDLYSSPDGSTMFKIDSKIQSYGIFDVDGDAWLIDLNSDGVANETEGFGWEQLMAKVQSLSFGWWNGESRFALLSNTGWVDVWGESVDTALSYGPAKDIRFATLNGEHWLLSLGSDAALKRNDGSGWQLVTNGVVAIDVAHWASRDYAFYLDSSHTLATSLDGITWMSQDSMSQQFAVGRQAGQTYLYDLTTTNQLKKSIGGGWSPVMSNVTTFALHSWAGANYAFYVTIGGLLRTSPDGNVWTPQLANASSMTVQTLAGVDTLFSLDLTGVLRQSTGSGWHVVIGGVTQLFGHRFAGSNTVFYLNNQGELFTTTDGTHWNDQGGAYKSVVVATMYGQDFLFALRSDNVLIGSVGQGWYPIDGNVKQLFQLSFVGNPLVEYVRFDRKSYSTTNGYAWNLI